MALPKTVRVGGLKLDVRLKDGVPPAGECAVLGSFDPHTLTIEIDRSASVERRWVTLLHEMAHAALDDSGLAAEMVATFGADAENVFEEKIVSVVCSQFLGALRAHGWLRFPGEK